MRLVTLAAMVEAQRRIHGVAVRTPLLSCLNHEGKLYLKPESLQPVGSFKIRGAYNKVAALSPAERGRGVIAYSSGNHAQAVAYAARAMGAKAVIVMPAAAPEVKRKGTAALGAQIVLVGPGSDERQTRAEALATEHGYTVVPPFNDELIIAGQGTIGLEILDDLADAQTVLVPVSGGGLISGIATAIKLRSPKTKVIGVEPELAADARASLRSGKRVSLPAEQTTRTIADGLRSQSVGEIPFAHINKYVDDIVTVSEEEIRDAIRRLLAMRLVIEPSGAVPYAAFLFHGDELPQTDKTVAVLSGGNIEPALLREIMSSDVSVQSKAFSK
jgi:threonine dehydratase